VSGRVEPPRIAKASLARALPADLRDQIVADLDEMFARRVSRDGPRRARIWYRGQALSFGVRFYAERVRASVRGRRSRGDIHDTRRWIPFPAFALLDWKLGYRMLAKHPGLSLISGVALTVAIGFGAGFFHAMRTEVFPKLGLDEGERIVRLDIYDPAARRTRPTTLEDLRTWREALTSVGELGAYRTVERNLVGAPVEGVPLIVAETTPTAFPLTRIPPLLGRALTDADARPGAPDVVVLGHEVWRTRLVGDLDALGREVQLGRGRYTVVGVMPPGFAFPRSHEAWVPLRVADPATPPDMSVLIFGRLAAGASLQSARAEVSALGVGTITSDRSGLPPLEPRVIGFADPDPAGDNVAGAILANTLVLLMLTAVAANVATLVFARTALREGEIVVRNALGATRARIIGQLFVEALVLASLSGLVGLVGARGVIEYVWRSQKAAHVQIPFWWTPHFDVKTVLYTAGLAVLGAALVALLPALKASGVRVQDGLKNIGSGATHLRFGGAWAVIIVFQVALTVVSLPFGVGYARDVWRSYRLRAAFPAEGYLALELALDADVVGRATDGALAESPRVQVAGVYEELTRRLAREPGVEAVTFGSGLPGMRHRADGLEVESGGMTWPYHASVDVAYFDVFGVPVVAGRPFNNDDVGAPNRPVLVNESFARWLEAGELPPGKGAVGARLRWPAGVEASPAVPGAVIEGAPERRVMRPGGEPGPWMEVVGVVRDLGTDVYNRDPTHGPESEARLIFYPVSPADVSPLFVGVKTSDPAALAPRLREIARQVDPGVRLYDVLPLAELIRRADRPEVLAALSSVGGILLCILLSAAGLFALMAVAVARRTREIGIRLALGAGRVELLAALFGRAALQLLVGTLVGIAFVVVFIAAFDRVQLTLLPSLLTVAAFMAAVGLLACAVPAGRALRVQPTEALREG
jgi:predicted permease